MVVWRKLVALVFRDDNVWGSVAVAWEAVVGARIMSRHNCAMRDDFHSPIYYYVWFMLIPMNLVCDLHLLDLHIYSFYFLQCFKYARMCSMWDDGRSSTYLRRMIVDQIERVLIRSISTNPSPTKV